MKGIGVSPGIAIGKAVVMKRSEHTTSGIPMEGASGPILEIANFDRTLTTSIREVEAIISNNELNLNESEIEILETQIEFLNDPQLRNAVLDRIQNDNSTAHDSLIQVIQEFITRSSEPEYQYTNRRAANIQDIGNRLLRHLNDALNTVSRILEENTIIIAEDISLSETVTMDLNHVIGFATRKGNKASHSAVLAKSRGIPAVVGCGDRLGVINTNDIVILDGKSGRVLINPDTDSLDEYIRLRAEHIRMSEALKSLMGISAVTADGTEITLLGTIPHVSELNDAFENGAQGVSLFSKEMCFVGCNSLRAEDEQFEFYRNIGENSNDYPVVIRTADIGGDKQLRYRALPEQNPVLNYHAAGLSTDPQEIFRTQLKAILRASVYGNLKIIFPMISNIAELRAAKEILEQSKEELRRDEIMFDENIETGILIEMPSAAITSDILAGEVDFLSIGTDNLCKYSVAVECITEKPEHTHNIFSPAILRLLKYTVDQAEKHHIHVGVCGEMTSDPVAVPLLLGMGFREMSMNARSISEVKEIILNTSMNQAREVCSKVMAMESPESILKYLHAQNGSF